MLTKRTPADAFRRPDPGRYHPSGVMPASERITSTK